MKIGNNQIIAKSIVFVFVLLITSLLSPAYCQSENISLVVRQTPDNGGSTIPATGVYTYKAGEEISLVANPNPGYQFLYWLGDVVSPESDSTTVKLDESKVIVAVYVKVDSTMTTGGGMNFISGQSSRASTDLYMPGGISGGGGGGDTKIVYSSNPAQTPEVPEPSTIILFGLGSFAVMRRRKCLNKGN